MKKKVIITFSIMFITLLLSIAISIGVGDKVNKDTSMAATDGMEELISKDKINILEIVPHEGKARLAYMVAGSEPVPLTDFSIWDFEYQSWLYGYYDDGTFNPSIELDPKYDTVQRKKAYYYQTNVFTRAIFGSNNLDVTVTVTSPKDLTEDMINNADLIYMGNEESTPGLCEIYVEYVLGETKNSTEYNQLLSDIKNATYKTNDITWENALALYTYTVENKKPFVYNEVAFNSLEVKSNFSKLYIMLHQLKNFKDNYNKLINSIEMEIDWETGKYKGGSITWNYRALYEVDITSEDGCEFLADSLDNPPYSITNGNIWVYSDDDFIYDFTRKTFDRDIKFWGEGSNNIDKIRDMGVVDIFIHLIKNSIYTDEEDKVIDITKNFTILEIEPSKSFFIKDLLIANGVDFDDPDCNIKIVERTTQAFNTMNNDLEGDYDLIIIGMDTGGMNVDDNGKTIYNDILKNGRIYNHVGDIVRMEAYAMVDTQEHDYDFNQSLDGFTRFNGNDITNLKMKELNLFLSRFTILTDNRMYKDDKVDTYYIDKNSVVFDFMNDNIMNDNLKRYTFNNENNNKDLFKLIKEEVNAAVKKPEIKYFEFPEEYVKTGDKGLGKAFEFITGADGEPERILHFKLKANDTDTNETLYFRLTLDTDGDGRFDDESTNGAMTIAVPNGSNSYNGDIIIQNNKFNQLVVREYEVPKNFSGLLTWKIEIINSKGYKDYRICYGAVKAQDEEKVKILHLTPNNGSNFILTNNAENQVGGLLNNLSQMNIKAEVVEMTFKSFSARYNDNPYNKNDPNKNNYLIDSEYDIIVVGFKDSMGDENPYIVDKPANFDDITNINGALDNILDYINLGKSMFFSHDSTTFHVRSWFTQEITGQFKTALGLDRFFENDTFHADDWKYQLDEGGSIIEIKKREIPPASYVKYPEAEKNFFVMFTDALILNRYYGSESRGNGYRDYKFSKMNNKYSPYNKEIGDIGKQGNLEVEYVQQANLGAISIYPYRMSENVMDGKNLKVANTHSQWFALDLEDDDLSVWYTLTGKTYDYSPLDGRSNYFIYTKGNLTYCGSGHNNGADVTEMKLLVNSIVSSLTNANHEPYIELRGLLKSSDEKYYQYISEVEDKFTFEFRAADKDIKDTKFHRVEIYIDLNDSEKFDEGDRLLRSYKDSNRLNNDMQWRSVTIDNIDQNWFTEDNNYRVKVICEVNDARNIELTQTASFEIIQRKLFDLK